jgi:hypothetical protein
MIENDCNTAAQQAGYPVGEERDPDPAALEQGTGRDLTCQPYSGATAMPHGLTGRRWSYGGLRPSKRTGTFGTHAGASAVPAKPRRTCRQNITNVTGHGICPVFKRSLSIRTWLLLLTQKGAMSHECASSCSGRRSRRPKIGPFWAAHRVGRASAVAVHNDWPCAPPQLTAIANGEPEQPGFGGGGTVATWPPHLRCVVKATLRLSAGQQTATARPVTLLAAVHRTRRTARNLDRQPGEHDAPSNRVLPVPDVVPTHQPPVPAKRRPAVHREPGPPRACATPRPSRTRPAGHHAPRPYRAQRHLTSGVAGPGTVLAGVGDAPSADVGFPA